MRNIFLTLSFAILVAACAREPQIQLEEGTSGDSEFPSASQQVKKEEIFGQHENEPKANIRLTAQGATSAGTRGLTLAPECNTHYGCNQNPISAFIELANYLFAFKPKVSTLGWIYFGNELMTENQCVRYKIDLTETANRTLARVYLSYNGGKPPTWTRSGTNNSVLSLDYEHRGYGQGELLFAILANEGEQKALSMKVSMFHCEGTTGTQQDKTKTFNLTTYVNKSQNGNYDLPYFSGSLDDSRKIEGRFITRGDVTFDPWQWWVH